jgi:hypothetical protein
MANTKYTKSGMDDKFLVIACSLPGELAVVRRAAGTPRCSKVSEAAMSVAPSGLVQDSPVAILYRTVHCYTSAACLLARCCSFNASSLR